MSNEEFELSASQELSGNDTPSLKENLKTEALDDLHRQKAQKRKNILLCLLSIFVGRVLYRILAPTISFAFGYIISSVAFLNRILGPDLQADHSLTLAAVSCLSLSIPALPTVFLCEKICGRIAPICIYTICFYMLSFILHVDALSAESIILYLVVVLTFGFILILDIVKHRETV